MRLPNPLDLLTAPPCIVVRVCVCGGYVTIVLLFLQLGRRMAEFPVDPMMSKMLIASEK